MSRHLFGTAGQAAEPRRVRADRRPRARAGGALAVVEPRGALAPQPRRARRGCARKGSSPSRRSGRRVGTSIRIRPYPGASDPRGGYAKEYPAPAVPRAIRRRPSARLGSPHDVRARPAGGRRAGGAQRAARFNDPELQAALVAIDPRTGNLLALVGGRDFGSRSSTARAAAGVSRARRSSRCSSRPRSRTAIRPSRSSTG